MYIYIYIIIKLIGDKYDEENNNDNNDVLKQKFDVAGRSQNGREWTAITNDRIILC